MKLLVAVKRVIDFNVKPRVKMDGSGVDLANVKMSMNPFDEIAVEEAIRLKDKAGATEIVVMDCHGAGGGWIGITARSAAGRRSRGRRRPEPSRSRGTTPSSGSSSRRTAFATNDVVTSM